jgi:hypothetical protein
VIFNKVLSEKKEIHLTHARGLDLSVVFTTRQRELCTQHPEFVRHYSIAQQGCCEAKRPLSLTAAIIREEKTL